MAEDTVQVTNVPDETGDQESQGSNEPKLDAKALEAELKKARREAASYRTKLREREEFEAAKQREEMSELERLKTDLEAERKARLEVEEKTRVQALHTAAILNATALNFEDPKDVVLYIDVVGSDPESIEDLVKELAESKPYLLKRNSSSSNSSRTNPAGGEQRPSDAQMRQEIFSNRRADPFAGGGVVWNTTE